MGKGSVQYAALPWRLRDGALEILLITTSTSVTESVRLMYAI